MTLEKGDASGRSNDVIDSAKSTRGDLGEIELVFALLMGGGVGVLLGLSETPLVATVMASVLTLVTGAAVAVSGINFNRMAVSESAGRRTLIPIALIVIGIAIGSCAGLYMRSHRIFVPEIAQYELISQRFKVAEIAEIYGLEESEVGRRFFEIDFGTKNDPKLGSAVASPNGGGTAPTGLVSISTEMCSALRADLIRKRYAVVAATILNAYSNADAKPRSVEMLESIEQADYKTPENQAFLEEIVDELCK